MTNKIESTQNLLESTEEVIAHHDHTIASLFNNPYLKAATSDNTRKAYQSDIKHYEQWGGKLPATSQMIIHYLQAFAAKLNSRTLSR